jgi:isoleucyl-tRNA synthetase
VAENDGLVVVLDTVLTPELVVEGDARELQRAIQDLRKDAALELDDRVDLWVHGARDGLAAHLPSVAAETLAAIVEGDPPDGLPSATIQLESGPVVIALRRRAGGR